MRENILHNLRGRSGLTLFELLAVLAIVACLTALVVVPVDDLREASQVTITEHTLLELRGAISGSDGQSGYRADVGELPLFVADLYQQPLLLNGQASLSPDLQQFDPITRHGWRGPYLQHTGGAYVAVVSRGFLPQYGVDGWPTAMDAWCRPIVLQWPDLGSSTDPRPYVRLVSAGLNGVLETPVNVAYPSRAICGDDVVLYLQSADLRP